MVNELKELWRFRELLRQMVTRELKVRYKNSIFGFLWSIVPPLLQVLVYTFLVKGIMHVPVKNYSAYLLCGLIPWLFTSTAILDSCSSLLNNSSIIKKVYMPREIIPLAFICGNFIHMMMGWTVYFIVFFGIARLFGVHLPILVSSLWFPFITLMLLCFVTGVSLWVAALNVFYEDIKFIVQSLFSLLLFLLPIIYPADCVYYNHIMYPRPWLFKLYMLNPIAAFLTAYRKTLLEPVPLSSYHILGNPTPLPMDWTIFAYACLISVLILLSGLWYFTKKQWQFVEQL
jgi:ABC-type polysaccharide/polyol phosphate export permease